MELDQCTVPRAGREDEIMQEEEVEQEDIDPMEELEQQDPGDSRKLF